MTDKLFVEEDHAKIYSSFRKEIPAELEEKIISFLKEKYDGPLKLAADVGCGAGQSTICLAPYFEQVHGLDVSQAQIEQAKASRTLPNLQYTVSPAEQLPFADSSVQLATAASALHWFDTDRFMPEVRRILCNRGVLAVFVYIDMSLSLEDPSLANEMDQIFVEFFEALDPYWHPNVQIAKDLYKNVHFPFEEVIRAPVVRCTHKGRPSDILNYATTFSGFQNFVKADPQGAQKCLDRFRERLYGLAASVNIVPDGVTTLFRDFHLILCRKIEE